MSEAASLPVAEGKQQIFGMELRPFTIGTFELCKRHNLTMLIDGVVPEDVTERMRQVSIYLYIQSQPFDEMLERIESPDFETNYLRRFQFSITPAMLEEAVELIGKNLMGAGEMSIEVQERASLRDGKEESPPPNS